MRISVIKPDGSLMYYPKIRGIAELEDGGLVLLHEDDSERIVDAKDFVKLEAEKAIFRPKGLDTST